MKSPDRQRFPLLHAINHYYHTMQELYALIGKPKNARRRSRLIRRADWIIRNHFHNDGGNALAKLIRTQLKRDGKRRR